MKIGIVGGGFTGLVLAQKLSANRQHQVQVFEKDDQIGGLATYHDYGPFYWDRFYHVILPGDKALLDFISGIGLQEKLRWKKTYTGVYVDKQFYSVSNNKEFLLFPPLNLIQKFRLAMTILIASRIKDWKKMETLTVEEWLVRVGGKKTYEKFWKPLLLAKLGDSYKRVSAVFIWTYINRLFEARNSEAHQEQMGYVSGGYKTVFDQLEERFVEQEVKLHKSIAVDKIQANQEGEIEVFFQGKVERFDKLIFTAPNNILAKTVDPDLYDVDKEGKEVEYLGVLCMTMLTRKEVSPFYVLNLADEEVPFTGVIGLSSLVDTQETADLHVTYLPKYILSTDPLMRKSDEEVKNWFLDGFHKLYPNFKKEDIHSVHINRAFKVQPLQVLNYSNIIPQMSTRHPNFYILNTSQFVNDTLNNNSVAGHVQNFLSAFENDFSVKPSTKKVEAEL